MYKGKKKVQLVSIGLPDAIHPHQLPLQLPLCRHIGGDHRAETAAHFEQMGLVEALEWATTEGSNGGPMTLVWNPDWAALTRTTGLPPPSADISCTECTTVKEVFRDPLGEQGPLRDYGTLPTQCQRFLRLFKSRFDIVYDILHDLALTFSQFLHVLYMWVMDRDDSGLIMRKLESVYRKHLTKHP